MSAPHGPYATEAEARAAAHQVVAPEPGWSILRAAGNRELLRRALDDAGVTAGAYDERIAGWLAGFEDAVCAVVAGWVARAHAAGTTGRLAGEAGRCRLCGGPVTRVTDPYDGVTPRWRHLPRRDPVSEFLDADHGGEPKGGAE